MSLCISQFNIYKVSCPRENKHKKQQKGIIIFYVFNRQKYRKKVGKSTTWLVKHVDWESNEKRSSNIVEFFEKRTSFTPWYAHVPVRIRGKKCSFFGKSGVLCFPETPVLRFALLPYYRRYSIVQIKFKTCRAGTIHFVLVDLKCFNISFWLFSVLLNTSRILELSMRISGTDLHSYNPGQNLM